MLMLNTALHNNEPAAQGPGGAAEVSQKCKMQLWPARDVHSFILPSPSGCSDHWSGDSTLLKTPNKKNVRSRLGQLGRMMNIRRCWAGEAGGPRYFSLLV